MADNTTWVDPFAAALQQIQLQQETIASYSLTAGVKLLQKGRYDDAIVQLRKATALNPNLVDAFSYLGGAYSQVGKKNDAITAYKNMIKLTPGQSDGYIKLGNLYLEMKKSSDAETQFKKAVSIDPTSTVARYTLGQIYVNSDRAELARIEFSKVVSISPRDGNAHYALGLAYNKLGRYRDALSELQKATNLKKDFDLAIFELGNAYHSLGEEDNAQKQLEKLRTLGSSLYTSLKDILFTPKITGVASDKTAGMLKLGPGSQAYFLDASLAFPGSSKDFTLTIQFNGKMDSASVTNPYNWSITRAKGGAGGMYITTDLANEAAVSPIPKYVSYNATLGQAKITFTVAQNATSSAKIDPSHLVFRFSGEDISGKAIDPGADEYDGFADKAF